MPKVFLVAANLLASHIFYNMCSLFFFLSLLHVNLKKLKYELIKKLLLKINFLKKCYYLSLAKPFMIKSYPLFQIIKGIKKLLKI